jgi:ribosomal protein S18 acetylase RimI-like enzyme
MRLYKCGLQDIGKISGILGEAFTDYPTFEYIFPDRLRRQRNIGKVMSFLLKCGIWQGEVLAPSENLEGVSVWYNTTDIHLSPGTVFRAGLLDLLISLDFGSFCRFMKLGSVKGRNRKNLISGECGFLDMIGIDSLHQNRGFAKQMIMAKLEKFDAKKIPCYLETSNVKNVEYYAKYGFRLVNEYSFDRLTSYCMIRDAR